MRVRVIWFCLMYLGSSSLAWAQDVCATSVDMKRMFITLQTIASQNAPARNSQILTLNTIDVRYSAGSVQRAYQQSELADQAGFVSAAFEVSHDIVRLISENRTAPPLLTSPQTQSALTRGLSVIGRLDCPPAIGRAAFEAAPSALLRAPSNAKADEGLDFSMNTQKFIYVGSGVVLFGVLITTLILLQARQASLAKRYVCDLDVTFELHGDEPEIIKAHAEDISRGGVKIRADAEKMPPLNSHTVLTFNGSIQKKIHVRWHNAHFFGGQFAQPFTAKDLRTLVGRARALRRRPMPKIG